MEGLSNVLVSSPKLSVIAGPVHSGKTKLVNRVIMDLPKRTQQLTRVKPYNLRQEPFLSLDSFSKCLEHDWLAYDEHGVTKDDIFTHSTQYPIYV